MGKKMKRKLPRNLSERSVAIIRKKQPPILAEKTGSEDDNLRSLFANSFAKTIDLQSKRKRKESSQSYNANSSFGIDEGMIGFFPRNLISSPDDETTLGEQIPSISKDSFEVPFVEVDENPDKKSSEEEIAQTLTPSIALENSNIVVDSQESIVEEVSVPIEQQKAKKFEQMFKKIFYQAREKAICLGEKKCSVYTFPSSVFSSHRIGQIVAVVEVFDKKTRYFSVESAANNSYAVHEWIFANEKQTGHINFGFVQKNANQKNQNDFTEVFCKIMQIMRAK